MSQPQDPKFEGWMGLDPDSVNGKMVWSAYEPKPWEETDIDIRITHCGMCGTDVHMLRSGWGPSPYPLVVGHEIVGIALRVGSNASPTIRTGDRVGVGSQGDSCRNRVLGKKDYSSCEPCKSGAEQYCEAIVMTYGVPHFNGGIGQGGFALFHRSPGHFVVKVPDGVESRDAAPMLCGGLTAYSPLRHFGGKEGLKGMSVGIVGVGGIGHFGILFAKALGADKVVGISRRRNKKNDVLAMGADAYIATEEDEGWRRKNRRTLHLILSTVSSAEASIAEYVALLKQDGTFCQLGNPDDGVFTVPAPALITRRINLTGSCAGSPDEIREMFQLAANKGIRPWIQERPMREANQAIIDLEDGKARYKYVLVNEPERASLEQRQARL